MGHHKQGDIIFTVYLGALFGIFVLFCLTSCIDRISFFLRFYIFIFRERGRERDREKNVNRCERYIDWLPLLHPSLRPRHVSWLGIELATFRFAGWHSIHWATPARVVWTFLMLTECTMKSWQIIGINTFSFWDFLSKLQKKQMLSGCNLASLLNLDCSITPGYV